MFFRMLWQSKREKTRSHHWNVAWKKAAVFLCCPDFCTTQRLLHFWYVYLRLDLPMGAEWMIRAPLQSNSALRKMLVRLDLCFVCWAFYSSQLFCCWTNSWAIDIVNIHWLYLHCFSLSNWLSKLCPTVPVLSYLLGSRGVSAVLCELECGKINSQDDDIDMISVFSRISFDQNPWAQLLLLKISRSFHPTQDLSRLIVKLPPRRHMNGVACNWLMCTYLHVVFLYYCAYMHIRI